MDWRSLNYVSRTKINRALEVVDGDPGPLVAPVCKSVLDATDPSCVPINIFQLGLLTPAALAYVSASGEFAGRVRETVVDGSLTGDVGLQSPWATSPVELALGGEYRLESLRSDSDAEDESGDLEGFGQIPSLGGQYDVW